MAPNMTKEFDNSEPDSSNDVVRDTVELVALSVSVSVQVILCQNPTSVNEPGKRNRDKQTETESYWNVSVSVYVWNTSSVPRMRKIICFCFIIHNPF